MPQYAQIHFIHGLPHWNTFTLNQAPGTKKGNFQKLSGPNVYEYIIAYIFDRSLSQENRQMRLVASIEIVLGKNYLSAGMISN